MLVEPLKAHSRITPPHPGWVQDLCLRDSPAHGKADSCDELNHLDDVYLEFSTASNIPRGMFVWLGVISFATLAFVLALLLGQLQRDAEIGVGWVVVAAALGFVPLGLFFFRLDLRMPKDRPVRFNRRQGKVYASFFSWTHNPFGRWPAGANVFEWDTLQAPVTRQVSASGEVVTQRYALELVSCKPGTFEELGRFSLQQGAMTTRQYEEQWELIRRYMAHGLEGLPPQHLRNQTPPFVDCLLFAMPWFSPTDLGRRTRQRMKGVLGFLMMFLISLLFPMWLVFGLGNFIVMRVAPESSWPQGMDEESRR